MCRAAVQACGLSLLGPENPEANVVTAFLVPEGVDGKAIPEPHEDALRGRDRRRSGRLSGKIARIGHCGYFDFRDIVTTIAALELVLQELGRPVELGSGVAAAQRVLAETRAV